MILLKDKIQTLKERKKKCVRFVFIFFLYFVLFFFSGVYSNKVLYKPKVEEFKIHESLKL